MNNNQNNKISSFRETFPEQFREFIPSEVKKKSDGNNERYNRNFYSQSNYLPNYPQRYNSYSYPGRNVAFASLACGILSIVWAKFIILGIALGIAGIVLSIMSKKKITNAGVRRNGVSIAGLVCSIVGIFLSLTHIMISFFLVTKFFGGIFS